LIVVDASALLDVLLRTPAATALERQLFADGETLHAPHLIDLEVAQVLRRYTLSGEITDARAVDALRDLAAFPIERYWHLPFLARVWELRSNFTAYDAAYVALAEVLDAPLLTSDARLSRASGHRARIITPKMQ
jgi:predicted nucleic acid-binding protein